MRHDLSTHFRKDYRDEVEAALAAGNSPDSVQTTLESRLDCEQKGTPRDEKQIQRIRQQLAYVSIVNSEPAAVEQPVSSYS